MHSKTVEGATDRQIFKLMVFVRDFNCVKEQHVIRVIELH